MLTKAVPSPSYDADQALLAALGMTFREPFKMGHPTERAAACATSGCQDSCTA